MVRVTGPVAHRPVRSGLVSTEGRGTHGRDAAVAAGGWAAVYVAVWATGQRLSTVPLESQWQLLPLDTLSAHPVRSVWYLHIQPPLWNLAVGVLARWSPFSLAVSIQLLMLASGCALAACVTATLRNLGVTRGPALALTALGTLNGGMLLAGFRPQYELPVAALLASLVWLATRRPGERSPRTLLWFSALLTALVLTRSVYHPVLVPAALGLLWFAHARHVSRRVVLIAWAIPLVLVGGWLIKNEVLFGTPTMASWGGMNVLRSVAPAIDSDRMEELYRDGTIGPVAAFGPFGGASDYAADLPPCTPAHDDPTLTLDERAIPPDPDGLVRLPTVANFNNECLLPAYEEAGKDATAIIRAEPGRWLVAREWSLSNWFHVPTHPTDSPLVDVANRFQNVGMLVVAHPGMPSSWSDHRFWVHGGSLSLVLILASVLLVVAALRRLKVRGFCAEEVPMVLGGLLVAWTFVIGITFELGEQERFRMVTDPVAIALAGVLVLRWRARRASTKTAAPAPPPSTPEHNQRRNVALAGAVLALGIVLVNVRDGDPARGVVDEATAIAQVQAIRSAAAPTTGAPTTGAPTTGAPTSGAPTTGAPTTDAPAGPTSTAGPATTRPPTAVEAVATTTTTQPTCTFIAHLGDSNLGMTAGRFNHEYTALGIDHVVDSGNGRGAHVVVEGTTALDAIATVKRATSPEGRCWILGLSNADARQSLIDGTDPLPLVLDVMEAVGEEPTIWIPPVLASATTDWNLTASTAYELAVREAAATRPYITVMDWPAIALQHLDQFQSDGIHYTVPLYDLFISTVLGQAEQTWGVGR